MTGRERVLLALDNKAADRTPWVPFVGCHAAQLIGRTAGEYLRSTDLIVAGVNEAVKRYKPDGIPVAFDLQIEAEALGCELAWADTNPPAVSSHILAGRPVGGLRVPGPGDGRFPVVLDAARQLRALHPDVALYGLVTGPFTLALHLVGANIFMMMFDQPDEVAALMAFCRDVTLAAARYYLDAGCDIIAVVDPMTSQIGPEHFARFVSPYVKPVFDAVRASGGRSSFFVCGHAQANIAEMCKTGPDNISIDENIQLSYVRDVCRQHGISFGGNMQLTVVLLFGTKEDCLRNALDCLRVGGTTGFILSPGCDLPYATPVDNLVAVADLVRDPYQQKVAAELVQKAPEAVCDLDMSDYGNYDKVVVDIITLDSEACAPCQYMVEAVKQVMPAFEDLVTWREHKIKEKDSVVFMTALMVRNVPTICIDGEIKFISRIPSRDELIRAIQERINEKFKLQLKAYQAKIVVLGGTCDACEETLANVRKAVQELGMTVPVEYVTDPAAIAGFEVNSTPTVITVQNTVKSCGRVPKVEIIKEWLKDLRL